MAGRESAGLTAVADASFLIGLSLIERLSLLPQLVDRICVAPAVWQEVVEQGAGRPGAVAVPALEGVERCPVQRREPVELLEVFLGSGEAESLVLAQELGGALLLLDDLKARRAAQGAGLRTVGVAGFLLAAKQAGLIPAVRPLLEQLRQRGFRLSEALMDAVLRDADEAPASEGGDA